MGEIETIDASAAKRLLPLNAIIKLEGGRNPD